MRHGLSLKERFELKYVKTATCWNWIGYIHPSGYGQFAVCKNRSIYSHRFAYELYKEPITDGLHVLHSCDNRKCVNPSHLRLGTNQENMNDKVERGRSKLNIHIGEVWYRTHKNHIDKQKGSGNHLAKLTEDDVREIRILCEFAFTHKELSKMYDVSRPVMSKVIRRQSYTNVY